MIDARTTMNQPQSGFAAATVFASGIGCFAMGVLTTASEASKGVGAALNWVAPVGALSGKSTLAILVWLVCWGLLTLMWRYQRLNEERIFKVSYVLIAMGFLGTFPPFFDLF
jgi:hypothetical protein